MTADGELLERYVYDPWGNAVQLDSFGAAVDTLAIDYPWSGSGIYSKIVGSHGYTGHEHIVGCGLINANARIYDPFLGRFLSPDPLIQDPASTQNFNRYAYCLNNPLKYTDEDGESIMAAMLVGALIFGGGNLAVHAIRKDHLGNGVWFEYFMQGAFAGAALGVLGGIAWSVPVMKGTMLALNGIHAVTTFWGAVGSTARDGFKGLGNTGKLILGNFYLDENASFWGGVGQGILRHSWEFMQTGLGYDYSQIRNAFWKDVDRVDYLGGATFFTDEHSNADQGVTIGSFINIDISDKISGNFDSYVTSHPLFMHEYGHTIDSRRYGPAYLFAIGIPSLISASSNKKATWTSPITGKTNTTLKHSIRKYEMRANRNADNYFYQNYGVNWISYEDKYPTQIL